MLHRVGRPPLSRAPASPAPHVVTCDPFGALADRTGTGWKDWRGRYPFGGFLFHGAAEAAPSRTRRRRRTPSSPACMT